MDPKMVELYAAFAVRNAVNVQKGQTLIINCPVECAWFARLCAAEAYLAGAKDVEVIYNDEKLSRIRMQGASQKTLEDVKPWVLRRYLDQVESEGGACYLAISARDPEAYKGIDTTKVAGAQQALATALKPWRELTMNDKLQWAILSVPTEAWARMVFPGDAPANAVEKLWDAIFKVARVEGGDPAGAWKAHTENTQRRVRHLNALALDALHLVGENGTDLTVGLADGHLFTGVGDHTITDNVLFFANVPSEEVFTAPHRLRVDGIVKSSLPYVYNGNVIEGITARFEKGVAVQVGAERGADLLRHMMDADEGAKHLGEIALVPATSPVRQTGLLFYNTLFDENAACHMAFGAAYPNNLKNARNMSADERLAAGLNDSLIHEDIMIGTPKMSITGILKDGGTVPIFRDGEWAF